MKSMIINYIMYSTMHDEVGSNRKSTPIFTKV